MTPHIFTQNQNQSFKILFPHIKSYIIKVTSQFQQRIDKNLILKVLFILNPTTISVLKPINHQINESMFKQNIEHSRSTKILPFTNAYQRNDGYQNIDSPMKAAFRQQVNSPQYNLSPMKMHRQTGRMNKSRSPILLSKRQDNYMSGTKNLSPFRRNEYRQSVLNNDDRQYSINNGEEYQQSLINNHKNMSFTNLIRKTSNTCHSPHNYPIVPPMQHSTSAVTYLQSDRNFREDTNLFKKLANMLESNKSNQNQPKSFGNSVISENSVNPKILPQSCKNATQNQSSNKKVMFKNVRTIESIQSPEDFKNNEKNIEQNIETKCYSEYDKMTTEYPILEKKQSSRKEQRNQPLMQRKFSQRNNSLKDEEPIFKKALLSNEKLNCKQGQLNTIDFDLTNSFGTVALKSQIGVQNKKQGVNPFEQIQSEIQSCQRFESMHSITQSFCQSQDSVFASVQMLLQKVNDKQPQIINVKQNESINLSILSQNSMGDLDMEPYIDKRR